MSPKQQPSNLNLDKEKAVVLLSGGLDSTVALAEALNQYNVVLVLTLNYGQRAFGKEIKAARYIAEYYSVRHSVMPLPWLSELLPKAMRINRDDMAEWGENPLDTEAFFDAQAVWVPNRNGLFINIAATYAESLGANVVVFGANAEEAGRFPDNTPEFQTRINAALAFSTLSQVRLESPVGLLNKAQIVDRALELNAPLHLIWSCYTNAQAQCGACPSCVRLKNALKDATKSTAGMKKQLSFSR